MRLYAIVAVVALSLGSSGCGIIKYSALNTVVAPARLVNECRNRNEECAAADVAWKQVQAACPDGRASKAYAKGFKKGFVEYLDANGNHQPPGMPPLWLRTMPFESPAGHQAIEDWYAGYRHGAQVAHDSGIRRWIVVPPSDMLPNSVVAPFNPASSRTAYPSPALPAPRKVPDLPAPDEPPPAGQARIELPHPARPVAIYSESR